MDIFGHQFYPTPLPLARKMIAACGGDLYSKSLLEPSAGKGDIFHAMGYDSLRGVKATAVEIDPELCKILREIDNVDVICDDFMDFESPGGFDCIIMNPPFDNGVNHLLRAWGMLNDSGRVVCLLNANNVYDGSSSGELHLARLIIDYGSVVDVGTPFSDSERPTDVRVVMVVLNKPPSEYSNVLRGNYDTIEGSDKYVARDVGIVTGDEIDVMCAEVASVGVAADNFYKAACELMLAMSRPFSRVSPWPIAGSSAEDILKKASSDISSGENPKSRINRKVAEHMWSCFMDSEIVRGNSTSAVRKELDRIAKSRFGMAFNKRNVHLLMRELVASSGDLQKRSLLESFDMLTKYYVGNRCHIEGWRNNDSYAVNKKVILPNTVDFSMRRISVPWSARDKLNDLDRTMCLLSSMALSDVMTICDAVEKSLGESEFFYIKTYNKGTLHLTFKDKDLLDKFNLEIAKIRNWLPSERDSMYTRQRN